MYQVLLVDIQTAFRPTITSDALKESYYIRYQYEIPVGKYEQRTNWLFCYTTLISKYALSIVTIYKTESNVIREIDCPLSL